jgi:hypothetical protein
MARRVLLVVLTAALLAGALQPSLAQSTAPVIVARPAVPMLDQEVWAGISYRDAMVGLVALGGGAVVVTWLAGSTISGITAAAAVAAAYLVYDPGPIGVVSSNDLPSLSDLAVNGSQQK